jgi:hypothetical protein
LFGRLKNFELDDRIGSSGFSKFEYPKEDTTHGVGYGVSIYYPRLITEGRLGNSVKKTSH